jgi:hypothetical protein
MSRFISLAAAIALIGAGAAEAAERNFPTGGNFDRVSNSTPFDVFVHTGKKPSIHAVGTDDALDKLQIENRGGELRIGQKSGNWFSGWHWGRGSRARIDVTVPMVNAVNLSGPGNLTVDAVRGTAFSTHLSGPGNINIGSLQTGALDLHLSGPGDIAVAGRAERATMSLSGPGNIRAAGLTLADATVSLSGPGDIDATVTRTADVRLSGPGDVRIRGGARCSVHKSGPGDVHCS